MRTYLKQLMASNHQTEVVGPLSLLRTLVSIRNCQWEFNSSDIDLFFCNKNNKGMTEKQAKKKNDVSQLARPASEFTLFKIKPAILISSQEFVKIDARPVPQGQQSRELSRKKKKKSPRRKAIQDQSNVFKLPKLQFNDQNERSSNHKNEEKSSKSQHHQRQHSQYREECQHRDKDKNPFKYKIVAQQAGIKDEKIYGLKQGEVSLIQKSYIKQIGLQYLHEGNSYIRRSQSLKTPNFKSYIHQIFNPNFTHQKGKNLEISTTQRLLKDCEEMQGHIVYKKVKQHLRAQRSKPNYFYRVQTESNIDKELVDFMRLKIIRAQARLKK